ncbi:hypothetical protein K7X08_006720 [Anisodus acutangulus]|uniref:AP2/ERF domain-containing protein n=1 Tax=Anisodus acutangulus TaxID=402998 RepID=A0A9Q1N091_9SOLA|nr:hypothetical protein K7X08_006720 [Anisodus acutangulus]
MKSPIKQDLSDENQEIKIQRKISDPDATESSSDDEQEKRPKLIVHQILQEKVNIQSFSLNDKNPLNFSQIPSKLPPRVRKRKSGKFCTEIKDPFTKKRIWLGTFNTAEEASHVYQSKKLEFEKKLKMVKSVIVKRVISAKSEVGCCSRNPQLMVDSQTLDSSNELVESVERVRNAKVKEGISANSLGYDQFSGKLPPMVRKRKSGKFGTEIKDLFTKKRIWLGTFSTAEEASQVYQSKKLEFEEKLKMVKNAEVEKVISAKSELGPSSTNDPSLVIDSQNTDSSNEFDEPLKKVKNANVERTVSAKSELGPSSTSDPSLVIDSQNTDSSNEFDEPLKKVKNANVERTVSAKSELGPSSTSDPSLVIDSQNTDSSNEFDEPLKKVKNANVESTVSAKSELGPSSTSDPSLVIDSQNTDSSNEFDEPLKKVKNANVEKTVSAKSEIGCCSSDPPIMVDSQTSGSTNVVEEKDELESEELWKGQWVQISEDKEVKFSMKLGVPVVDNYGYLLGEFSKLDDLSISV